MQLAQVYERLEEARCRVTPQRQAVLRILSRHLAEELSADDIRRLTAEEQEPVGLATVYRTLEVLVRVGVVSQYIREDGRTRYRLNVESLDPLHHLICVRCGDLTDLSLDWLGDLAGHVRDATGFMVLDQELKLYGVCLACQASDRRGVG
ncbi:MAG: Fur family transcriptional regulator [Clostridia bacterium]